MNGHKDDLAKELFNTIFGSDFDPMEMRKDHTGTYKKTNRKYSGGDDDNDDDDDDEGREARPGQNMDEFMEYVDRHMEDWLDSKKSPEAEKLPPITVEDDGSNPTDLQIVEDPVWEKRFDGKKLPIPYWEFFVKGRNAWQKKYTPGVPHGGRYRVYFHTPEGPLERVPAWAPYVLPGKHEIFE